MTTIPGERLDRELGYVVIARAQRPLTESLSIEIVSMNELVRNDGQAHWHP